MDQTVTVGEHSEWNRRKVILLGGEGVGKSSLFHNMLDTVNLRTESILRLTQLNYKVQCVIAENGKWVAEKTPKFELKDVISNNILHLSLLDFEGQSEFNIIRELFSTFYGVFIVVFTMMDVLDNKRKENSLTELSFWINTIVYHTFDAKTRKMAPMFLVGTHGDIVSDPLRHKDISDVIEEMIKYNAGWPHIVENNDLCFFPVNNNKNDNDPFDELDNGIGNLKSEIERVIKDSECTKKPKPLAWFKALDTLAASTKSNVTLKEASDIAVAHGVEQDAVPIFLSFLNKMGMVLWLDEEGLRDVVILDVMNFFIEPAALIICNHISNSSDKTSHLKKIQQMYERQDREAWDRMSIRGVVKGQLINTLLGELVPADSIPAVVYLMLKYGLIVRLEFERPVEQLCALIDSEVYLVPNLLPSTGGDPLVFEDEIWNRDVKQWKSCYFVFFTRKDSLNSCLGFSQLKHDCFLPRELMGRLIGKAAVWTLETNESSVPVGPCLYQDYAVFLLKQQHFRLVCIPELNCIRLDIEGLHPLPVYNRIKEQIDICVKDCMGSLQFTTLLPRNQ